MIYIIFSTDVWLTNNSFEVVGNATTLAFAISMIRQNEELLQPVIENDGHIVIKEYVKNRFDDGTIVFNTQLDEYKNQII